MKIKYLKDAPAGKKGTVAEVDSAQAKVLVKLGFAEEYKEPKKTSTRRKSKESTETETKESE